MAGGSGERFWPMSRKSRPKHLLKLFSDKTLLEETVRRLEGVVPMQNIFVLTNQAQLEISREALSFLPSNQVIAEPSKRDTAPAAALATAIARRGGEGSILALLPADALIKDVETFRRQFSMGIEYAAQSNALVTFSITPSFPSTGFGYLELGNEESHAIHRVTRFVEKPDLARAEQYIASGHYGWNSGIFIWNVDSFLSETKRLQPLLAQFILDFPVSGNFQPYLEDHFGKLPKISIDYAVMEQAQKVCAIKAEFDWDDVGNWTALPKHLGADANGNTTRGRVEMIKSEKNIVFSSGRAIALCGVSDLIVVETADAVLVCHKKNAQDIKNLLSQLPKELS